MNIEKKKQLELCAVHLTGLKGMHFLNRTITYYEETARSVERALNYLVCATTANNYLILGFHKEQNFEISQEPKLSETTQGNINFVEIVSKDKDEVSFITLDFGAAYFLFADKLNNGIAYYKTNARSNPETKVTKSRWLFREEFICET